MTRQESFKKKIRARMAKTGEKYGAARRALLDARASGTPPPRIEDPEYDDDAVRRATGRDWDEWCALIDTWPERDHAQIAARLADECDIGPWWSQTVTVGYERIRGLRAKYMRSDGSFAGTLHRTIAADARALDVALRDPSAHRRLFPDLETEIVSRPGSKAVRIAITDAGQALISVIERGPGRTRVGIEHGKLESTDEVEHWKAWWADWCADQADV